MAQMNDQAAVSGVEPVAELSDEQIEVKSRGCVSQIVSLRGQRH